MVCRLSNNKDINTPEGSRLALRLVEILTWPLAWLPPRLGLAFGALGGRLSYRLWKRRRRIAVANLEMIKANGSLPADLPVEATARACFANMGRAAWEAVRFYHRGLEPFMKYCRVEEGREYLEEALAESRREERGLMLVTGHMGSWEIMCHYLPRVFDCTLNIVGRDTGKPLADALIRRLRTLGGNGFISKKGGAREMIAVLRSGGVLGTLIDQAVIGNHPGAPVPFLGREATTNLGPHRLARRAGCSVIMVLFRREGLYNLMKVCPPLKFDPTLDEEEALLAMARRLNDQLGDYIKLYPDQWMWGHRRWKTRQGVRQDAASII